MSKPNYIVTFEHPSGGSFGVTTEVYADSDKEAAELYPYASKGGRIWVIRKEDASTWRLDSRVIEDSLK